MVMLMGMRLCGATTMDIHVGYRSIHDVSHVTEQLFRAKINVPGRCDESAHFSNIIFSVPGSYRMIL